jgi:predicted nicotinamide N-methyase
MVADESPGLTDFVSFLRSATSVSTSELCPEVRLYLADDLDELWRAQESWLGRRGLASPFWGVAWPGGQGLARYVLDHPQLVRGRSVLDIGSGCGLCAVAAAKAGASRVEAADIDPYALEAISANAALNGARVITVRTDVIEDDPRWDVVLAADLWYEKFLAERMTGWLTRLARAGTTVLIGDRNRAFFPRGCMEEIAQYALKTPESLEREAFGATRVWRVSRVKA